MTRPSLRVTGALALLAAACSDDGAVVTAPAQGSAEVRPLVRLVEVLRPEQVEQSPLLDGAGESLGLPDGVKVTPLAGLSFSLVDTGGPDGADPQPATANLTAGKANSEILHLQAAAPRAASIRFHPLPLRGGHHYTLTGLIKTESVVRRDQASSATFLLEQRGEDSGSLGRGKDHTGTSAGWVRDVVTFTAPDDARELIVNATLGGMGFASGSVWFTDILLIEHPAPSLPAEVREAITAEASAWRFASMGAEPPGRQPAWDRDEAAVLKAPVQLEGRVHPALLATTPSTFTFPLSGSVERSFAVSCGIRSASLLPETSEVDFVVELEDTEGSKSEHVFTMGGDTPLQGWHDITMDLPADTAALSLTTRSSLGAEGVPAVWGHPTLRTRAASGKTPRHVVLISIDTLRADHVGAYGHRYETTPVIDGIARRGTLFERAYAHASFTLPSHVSMLTGLYPTSHGIHVQGRTPLTTFTTLADRLGASGFTTTGIHGGALMDPVYGFAKGFDSYEQVTGMENGIHRAVAALEAARGVDTFVFLHTYEVHSPYHETPESLAAFESPYESLKETVAPRWSMEELGSNAFLHRLDASGEALEPEALEVLRLLYDGRIRHADGLVGDLLARLPHPQETLIVLTSDHGDAFGEHGRFLHGNSLYDELLRVPLIIAGPGVPHGKRVDAPVGLVDIVPTVLGVLDLPDPAGVDGRSLAPDWRGRGPAGWVESVLLTSEHALVASTTGDHKYIYDAATGAEELYDLGRDHAERENLAAGDTPRIEQFREAMRPHLTRLPGVHLAFRNDGRFETLSGSVALGGGAPEIRRFFIGPDDEVRYDPETSRVHFRIALREGLSWLNLESGQPPEVLELHVELDGEPVPAGLVSAGTASLPGAGTGARAWRLRVEDLAVADGSDPAAALGLHVWAHGSAAPDDVTLDAEQLERLRELGYIR